MAETAQTYFIGSQRVIWERVRDDDNTPITPTSVAASLINRATGASVATLTTEKTAGRVTTVIPAGTITTPGKYFIDWDITYTAGTLTGIMTILTNVEATYRDTTSLMKLVSRLRVYINDNPPQVEDRLNEDEKLKAILVEAIRNYMSDYDITEATGFAEVTPLLTAGSDDEKLVILYGAYLYLLLHDESIKSEKTTMFEVGYDQPYRAKIDKLDAIWELIQELDPNAAMPILEETDMVAWGKVLDRRADQIAEWDTV